MLVEKHIDVDVSGSGGYTALHFAAAGDHPLCIKTLLDRHASLLIRSSNGTFPVHTAAKCGAARALEALILGAESQGLEPRMVLALKDREGQLPIHNAVNNGAAEDTGCTPVHYAATQGNLDLLKNLNEFHPDSFRGALKEEDYTGRTPIHWAAIFDHDTVVKYLIRMSDINTFDRNKNTPLLSAAKNACWKTLMVLLTHKDTNTEVIDVNQRNVLHLAVRQGVNLEETLNVWKVTSLPISLNPLTSCGVNDVAAQNSVRDIVLRCNEEDKTGSTPLHYAASRGDPKGVLSLLSLGAKTNVKNKLRQSPFHIACRYGRYNVCLLLLDQADGSRLKNEQDDAGESPLHMAAARGFTDIVGLLLQRGAVISKYKLHLEALTSYSFITSIRNKTGRK
ncbi:transient receptor potential cation channel subfamily a member 1 [Plakobranchus ocellatus]|uniref:Transient receptor potential cation channel subfamily a member 1 n=1 Tax=Plakobranchus ocellatus TaxID=259542 RepID=A0AAV3YUI3_9GAST|nr:transient receptor potential cation channel subfamily a member 1 [Plakobranchus ocellatus]